MEFRFMILYFHYFHIGYVIGINLVCVIKFMCKLISIVFPKYMYVIFHGWVWTLVIEQCVYVKFKYVYTRGGDSFPRF